MAHSRRALPVMQLGTTCMWEQPGQRSGGGGSSSSGGGAAAAAAEQLATSTCLALRVAYRNNRSCSPTAHTRKTKRPRAAGAAAAATPKISLAACLVLCILRQHVQRADGQPELAAVRELADAGAQADQLVARHLQLFKEFQSTKVIKSRRCVNLPMQVPRPTSLSRATCSRR